MGVVASDFRAISWRSNPRVLHAPTVNHSSLDKDRHLYNERINMLHQTTDLERRLFEDRLASLPPLYRAVLRCVRDGGATDDLAFLSGFSALTIERMASDLDEL